MKNCVTSFMNDLLLNNPEYFYNYRQENIWLTAHQSSDKSSDGKTGSDPRRSFVIQSQSDIGSPELRIDDARPADALSPNKHSEWSWKWTSNYWGSTIRIFKLIFLIQWFPNFFSCADHVKYYDAPRSTKYCFVHGLADHLS